MYSMDDAYAAQVSARMKSVRARNTKPELVVRRLLHSLGYRFRLHGRLPGSPDLVFAGRRKVIFVHGCFWHRHAKCPKTTIPRTNREFWQHKFAANRRRDRRNLRELAANGWDVIVVWQCETEDLEALSRRLRQELGKR